MASIYLALGSNVGNSKSHINKAIKLLSRTVSDIKSAPIYVSKAVGYTDQADFYNTALRGNTKLEPLELLAFVKEVESIIGRIQRFHWGPREIDIDIIFYDNLVIDLPTLIIPHPRLHERDFVLKPLADIDPELHDTVSGLSMQELLALLPKNEHSVLRVLY